MPRAYGDTKVWGAVRLTRLCTASWPLSRTNVSARTSPSRRTRIREKADTSSCSRLPKVGAEDIDQTTSATPAASSATASRIGVATLGRRVCCRLDLPFAVVIDAIVALWRGRGKTPAFHARYRFLMSANTSACLRRRLVFSPGVDRQVEQALSPESFKLLPLAVPGRIAIAAAPEQRPVGRRARPVHTGSKILAVERIGRLGRRPGRGEIVAVQSIVIAACSVLAAGGITPGQRTIAGTPMPPSHRNPF